MQISREDTMTERKVIMNDESLAQVSGGDGEIGDPKYNVGDTVALKFANEEGAITTIYGTVISVEASPVCWWYRVRYEVNGKVYEHRYPEFGLN